MWERTTRSTSYAERVSGWPSRDAATSRSACREGRRKLAEMGEPNPARSPSSGASPGSRDTASPMLADPRRSLFVAALLAAAAVIMCIVVWSADARSAVQWVDDSFLRLVERLRWEPLIDTAKALAFIGG